MRRRAGSVRFDPYYKVQTWDPVGLVWRDIQRRHDTEQQAVDSTRGERGRWRIMEITMAGRGPVREFER